MCIWDQRGSARYWLFHLTATTLFHSTNPNPCLELHEKELPRSTLPMISHHRYKRANKRTNRQNPRTNVLSSYLYSSVSGSTVCSEHKANVRDGVIAYKVNREMRLDMFVQADNVYGYVQRQQERGEVSEHKHKPSDHFYECS